MDLSHEQPSGRADLHIQRTPVPVADTIRVDYSEQTAEVSNLLAVDADHIATYLPRHAGMPEHEARSIWLRFMSPDEYRAKYNLPDTITAHYSGWGVALAPTNMQIEDEVEYLHTITIPLEPEYVSMQGMHRLNALLRHELAHARNHDSCRVPLYGYLFDASHEPSKLFGVLPVRRVAQAAEALGHDSLRTLHKLDKAERKARAFAKQHANLQPIALRDSPS